MTIKFQIQNNRVPGVYHTVEIRHLTAEEVEVFRVVLERDGCTTFKVL